MKKTTKVVPLALIIVALLTSMGGCNRKYNRESNYESNFEETNGRITESEANAETVDMKGEYDPATHMVYTLNDDGKSYSVRPAGFDVIKELVIPGEYKGLPVTKVCGYKLLEARIETIIISEGIKEVSGFDECLDIKNIYIPTSVIHIHEGTFNSYATMGGLPHFIKSNVIEKIVVAEGNPCYYVDGNCLIEKSSKKIILGCNSSVIPNDGSVKSIGETAFANCKSIETIILPKSIIELGYAAFDNCPNLKQVYITSSVSKDKKIVNFDEEFVFGSNSNHCFYVPDAESLEIYSKLVRPHIHIEISEPVTIQQATAADSGTLSDSIEAFDAILKGETAFFDVAHQTYTFLNAYRFPYLQDTISANSCVEYTVMDMNNDCNPELLIKNDIGDVLILHQSSDNVCGYSFKYSGMDQIYEDGSFDWHDQSGTVYGCSTMIFADNSYTVKELWRIENDGTENVRHYISDAVVSPARQSEYIQHLNHTSARWTQLGKS